MTKAQVLKKFRAEKSPYVLGANPARRAEEWQFFVARLYREGLVLEKALKWKNPYLEN